MQTAMPQDFKLELPPRERAPRTKLRAVTLANRPGQTVHLCSQLDKRSVDVEDTKKRPRAANEILDGQNSQEGTL